MGSERRLRIALLEPAGRGGIHHYTRALARALALAGSDVRLVTARDHEFRAADAAAPPPFTVSGRFARRLTAPGPLLSELRRFAPDVVHLQSGTHPLLHWLLLQAVRRATRAPITVTAHDLAPKNSGGFGRTAARWLHRAADRVIVHGRALRDELAATLPDGAARIRVVPHGDASELAALAMQNHAGPQWNSTPTLLFFGYLHAEKGLTDLLDALPAIAQKIPAVRLVIAGHPEMAVAPLQARARTLGVAERIDWRLGYVPVEQLAPLFTGASAVVLPYRKASQSGVAFLAGAFARPLVATRVGALSEIVDEGRTGALVPPGNPSKLAAACSDLLSDLASARNKGEEHARRCREEWSWTAIARTTCALYSELEKARPRTPGGEVVVDGERHACSGPVPP